MHKATTSRISVFEPDQQALRKALLGRDLSPELHSFLNNLLKRNKWTRKINIPSSYNNVAAVLVFTTALKETGLEIISELHVYFNGKVMVEQWHVRGGPNRLSLLPKESFRTIDIEKVRVQGERVIVEFSIPIAGGNSGTRIKTFDFAADEQRVRIVPYPLAEAVQTAALSVVVCVGDGPL
jgi:hypothetical protein